MLDAHPTQPKPPHHADMPSSRRFDPATQDLRQGTACLPLPGLILGRS